LAFKTYYRNLYKEKWLLGCMKRVFVVLMFLMLAGSVLAMDNPVSVKTQPGDWVKVYVWPVEIGPLLNMGDGIADENGTFETTFFSLNVPDVKFTVFVIRNQEKVRDADFLGHNISEPLNIDCRNVGCEKVEEIVEEVVASVENESVVKNETVIVEDEEISVNKFRGFVLNGRAIFSKDDGSINWGYSVGGFTILLLLAVFTFMILHHRKGKKVNVMEEDEKELAYMEKKVRETADKIKSIKDEKIRREKIYEAKVKLAEEEKELKELEAGESEAQVGKQEMVVERAEDKVRDIKRD